MTVLETLWLTANVNWLQNVADTRSVLKSNKRSGLNSIYNYAKMHMKHHKASTS